jgi:hypothetical protein
MEVYRGAGRQTILKRELHAMNRTLIAAIVAGFAAVGCSSVTEQSTGPTGAGSMLAGTWRSVESGSVQDSCTNFSWTVTEFTGNTGAGTFTATCFGDVQVAGSASGTMTSATTVSWVLTANASGPNIPASCPINVTGTAVIEGEFIRIPYSGSWCGGTLSGTELVRR